MLPHLVNKLSVLASEYLATNCKHSSTARLTGNDTKRNDKHTHLLDFFGAFDQLVSFGNRSSITTHPESLVLDCITYLAHSGQSDEADRKFQGCKQTTRRGQSSRDVRFIQCCSLVAPNPRCSLYLHPQRGTISPSFSQPVSDLGLRSQRKVGKRKCILLLSYLNY